MTDLSTLPIETFVPHRGAMCWLHRLVHAEGDDAAAEATVRPDMLFVQDGALPAWAAIEFMAQTIAAWAGHQAWVAGLPVKLGFLLGSRRFETFQPTFAVGSVLRIETRCELLGDNHLGMFSCRLLAGDSLLAQANVSVYEVPDERAFALPHP